MEIPQIIVLLLGVLACGYDVATGRIPNVVTFGAAAAAAMFHLVTGGFYGLGMSLGGWAVGALLFFPYFALQGMGAGDVKLLAAIGAWLGMAGALWTGLFAGIAGGVLALVVAFAFGYARQAFSNLWWLIGYWRIAGPRPFPEVSLQGSRGPRLAYSVPITLGALATIWLR